jgi:hypothetical protein
MRTQLARIARAAATGILLLFAGGCSHKLDTVFRDNMIPEVRLTQAPVSTQDKYFYAYRMNWVGYDPDGRIDHYLIAVDPDRPDSIATSGPRAWTSTVKNEEVIFFKANTPDSSTGFATANEYHTFAIAAVDNQGALSKPVWRTFFSFTQAPIVFIDAPAPNAVFTPIVTPTVRIHWRGIDPDGQFSTKPVKYRFRLFGGHNPDFPGIQDFVSFVISNPNFIRNVYAPTFGPSDKCPTCTAWDSSNADTTEIQYTNLVPSQYYLFAVTGFDEAGAYDPIFSPSSNLLKFYVTYAGTNGPQICMFNDFFNFCYTGGGYANDPTRYYNLEVPAGQPVTFYWIAIPPPGADMRRYRWSLDLQDLTDETPRTNEQTDWYHWSTYSLQNISGTVGPFVNNGEDHLFFIEAEDNNGLKSLGIIHFTVVKATFERDILFVDDTRLTPDRLIAGNPPTLASPSGTWPSAAELDTFFFAKGGFNWQGYPAGSLSQRGIFDGYPFRTDNLPPDTLGTRGIISGIVPLARLGRYKTVVWYIDGTGATYTKTPADLIEPMTSLRFMSQPGQPSTISTYMKQGGRVWMFGGAAVYATLVAWDKRNTPTDDWTNADLELIPGRFVYDFPHWQSAVASRPGARQAQLNTPDFASWDNAAMGRDWSSQGINRNLSQPNYGRLINNPLMQVLNGRTCGTDPPSALRQCNSFYLAPSYDAEYIGRNPQFGSVPNFIREDASTNPDVTNDQSTLDTLYLAAGGSVPGKLPVMTYYHGFQSPQMVFCGFPLWFFQRAQVQELSDFVLQEIFGYTRNGATATAPARMTAVTRNPTAAATAASIKRMPTKAPLRR